MGGSGTWTRRGGGRGGGLRLGGRLECADLVGAQARIVLCTGTLECLQPGPDAVGGTGCQMAHHAVDQTVQRIAALAELKPVKVTDVEGLVALAREIAADLVVVGPESALEVGLADRLAEIGIPCFGGSQRAFCAAVPNTTTGFNPKMFMCSADAPENPAPDSEIVCIINEASVMPSPAPPYSWGMAIPSQPSRAKAA